jgi:predicted MFS family arabinose efflux permease
MHNKSIRKSILLWLLANLFFAFQFILRLSAGILREDIIQKFSIDSASFGTLAGYYYLGYSSTQNPLGIMLDRLSFRLVTSLSIATSAVGTMMFVTSNNWDLLLFGRFLIGAGSGVAFLAIAKIIKIHFNEKFHSMLIGLSFSFGLTGAVFGSTPMKLLFEHFGYDYTFNILTLIGFVFAAMMLIFGKLETNVWG